MKAQELRDSYLEFFRERGHSVYESSSLIPENDPTLLFTVAGMVQFKPMFAGLVSLDCRRAASIQKCLRVVDIEEVGKSPFHDTFFEMLGNFSFGDYFQRESISWAWEYLTRVLSIDKNRLYVTVHKDDKSAYDIWHNEIQLSKERIIVMDDKTNFWGPAGGTGACGPSSEIFYDFGPGTEDRNPCSIENDCKRFVEVWNIVFPQFNQDLEGKRHPLKNKGVDTGMGLERLACVMQSKKTIFETDLFMPIINKLCADYSIDYDRSKHSVNSIADHVRALTFTISDGIIPENEGRGYVIRRILRRALRLGYKMGIEKPFLYDLTNIVVDNMSKQYKNLSSEHAKTRKIIESEEARFLKTIAQGVELYEYHKSKSKGDEISGEVLFQLYDTFGFPIDLVKQMAEEDNLKVNEKKFEILLEEAKNKSRAAKKFTEKVASDYVIFDDTVSFFTGYGKMQEESKCLMHRIAGDKTEVLFEKTPFYAESGGQAGDSGRITGDDFEMVVESTIKSPLGNVHSGKVIKGELKKDVLYKLAVSPEKRRKTERNHTATHILHEALRQILGDHVKQEGSFVSDEKLRFDFTHFSQVTPEEMKLVEKRVNEIIENDLDVSWEEKNYDDAIKEGATALFKEKYTDRVRVVSVGDVSMELCGGTHVQKTSQIGIFKITSEQSVAAGIRRLECVTSSDALKKYAEESETLDEVSKMLGASDNRDVVIKLQKLIDENRDFEKERIENLKKSAKEEAVKLIKESIDSNNERVIFGVFEGIGIDLLRGIMDNIKSTERSVYGALGSINANGIIYIVFSSNSSKDAKELIKKLNVSLSGKGGGKPDFCSGSSKTVIRRDEMLQIVKKCLTE
ncbi:MAG: alanine--tRNA ligase [bacterium]|nr:alanine--tRNA ligase [bacterium]